MIETLLLIVETYPTTASLTATLFVAWLMGEVTEWGKDVVVYGL